VGYPSGAGEAYSGSSAFPHLCCFGIILLITLRSLPFSLIAITGIYTLWPDERRNKYDTKTGLSKIDFVGNLLLVIASILLIFSIQEGASFVWKWSSPIIIWSMVISGACWFLLFVWETYLFYGSSQKVEPIFPLRLAVGRVYFASFV
jgi:hypothetical protein